MAGRIRMADAGRAAAIAVIAVEYHRLIIVHRGLYRTLGRMPRQVL